jgi:thiaminase
MRHQKFEELENLIAEKWRTFLEQPQARQFKDSIMGRDKRIFALYMTQVYHYAFHTARNQALVAVNPANTNTHYMQFCLEHALEETGHELMALHDLRSIGVRINDPDTEMPPAMVPTQLLVAYLYWVSSNGNPLQRLGYSFWAERSYEYIRDYIDELTVSMGLDKHQMTFFYNHSAIDDKHARDVENILIKACKTEEDWRAVIQTSVITLDLTFQIVKAVVDEYEKLVRGQGSDYSIINSLATVVHN